MITLQYKASLIHQTSHGSSTSENEDRYFLSYTFCLYQEFENNMVLLELQSFHIVLINYLFSYYNMQNFPISGG